MDRGDEKADHRIRNGNGRKHEIQERKTPGNRKTDESMKTTTKLLIPLIVLFVGLLTAQIVYSCRLVLDGKQVKEIDQKIDTVRQEVLLIEEQVASASALTTVREKAVAMGFEESPKVVTMDAGTMVVAFGQTR